MPVLLFKLNGVSEEEANEVRSLLDTHCIEFYETSAGRWGVSMPGIWLPDNDQVEDAKKLLEKYQSDRLIRFQQENHELMQESFLSSMWLGFKQRPVKFFLASIAIIFVIALSLYPLFDLFKNQ